MVNKQQVLKVLENTKFPDNETRKNILKKGQKHSKNITLGKVLMMFGKGVANSRNNKTYPELLKMLKVFLKKEQPKYRFEAVGVVKNHASAKHTDKYNTTYSYIIGLGNYTGGELVFSDGPQKGPHNIKNRWLKFNGSFEHYVKPFKGQRYTLVYYQLKKPKKK